MGWKLEVYVLLLKCKEFISVWMLYFILRKLLLSFPNLLNFTMRFTTAVVNVDDLVLVKTQFANYCHLELPGSPLIRCSAQCPISKATCWAQNSLWENITIFLPFVYTLIYSPQEGKKNVVLWIGFSYLKVEMSPSYQKSRLS